LTDFGRIDEEEQARYNPSNKAAIPVSFTGARLDLTSPPLDKEIHQIGSSELALALEFSLMSFKAAQQSDSLERHYLSSGKRMI